MTLSKGKRQILELLRSADRPMTPAEIADRLKLKYGTVRNYVRELEQSGKIRKLGHGQYIYEENGEPGPKESAPKKEEWENLVRVPLVAPRVGAGHPREVFSEQVDRFLIYSADLIRMEIGFVPSQLVAFRISGDSMEPTLRPGDVVIVAMHHVDLIEGSVYLIQVGDGLMIKRLIRLERHHLVFGSDNPRYDKLILQRDDHNQEEVRILGRVIKVEKFV